ncbi:hypothetical protein H6758_02435 [Candidatus Nomurabacteria bacterium]|nr:hypothetical protein [Candidatus Nomurabacteria bacterium]
MKHKIHLLNASSALNEYEKFIINSIDETFNRMVDTLPLIPIDVVVKDEPLNVVPETGIGGYTPDAYTIYLSLDANFKNFKENLILEIPKTIAHEYHHSLRWNGPGYGNTLGEAIISEGLADHFQMELLGGKPQPWCTALSENGLANLQPIATKEYWTSPYDHASWFFGNPDLNIPRWAGYSLGFYLVKQYLDKTGQKAAKLYDISAKEVIETL